MGGGEPADGRREGPMALPGRGELRTRRGAEVTVGAEGSGAGPGGAGRGRARGGSVPAGVALSAPEAAEGPSGLWCSEEPALLPPGPSEGRGARFPEAGVFASAPLSRRR